MGPTTRLTGTPDNTASAGNRALTILWMIYALACRVRLV